MTTGVPISIGLIELTPGDWDVSGGAGLKPGASTVVTYVRLSVGTAANASTADSTLLNPTSSGAVGFQWSGSTNAGQYMMQGVPRYRTTVSSGISAQTLWMTIEAGFSGGTGNAFGFIEARRRR
jgi:hypothetical protein